MPAKNFGAAVLILLQLYAQWRMLVHAEGLLSTAIAWLAGLAMVLGISWISLGPRSTVEPLAREPQVRGPRIATGAFALLAIALWMAPGLFARDPWKPDEAYTFGLVYHILNHGDWVVPSLAGEPFMEKPPVFFVSSALFASLLDGVLPLHDAARMATAFYVGMTLLFAWLAARRLYGPESALAAPLLLVAALGYLQPAHLLVTDNSLLASLAMALYGLALANERVVAGGVLTGVGAGIAFLSKGLLGPGIVALTALALPIAPAWRSPAYARAMALGALVFLPFLVVWPWLLYERAPRLFEEWLLVNNFGRYTGSALLGPEHDHLMYLKIAPWFALPALPLAAWTFWRAMRRGAASLDDGGFALAFTSLAVMFAVLSSACNQRYVYAIPMLLPLALAGAGAATRAPAWLAGALEGAAIALALLATAALWGGWWILVHHWPASVAAWLLDARPGYVAAADPTLTALAALVTLAAWLLICVRSGALDVALKWAGAVALAWGVLNTLWLPYLNFGNSYRDMAREIAARVPSDNTCVASRDLGEPQRAMLEYFGGIVTRAEANEPARRCEVLLVQVNHSATKPRVDPRWIGVWHGSRPGDANERFWLFRADEMKRLGR